MTENSAAVEPLYAAARTVLLDALDALAEHRSSLVVVGAQAVYVRTGTAGLATAPFTTDADVALDPSSLADDPQLESAMENADFQLKTNPHGAIEPGTWIGTAWLDAVRFEIPVDLIVPEGALSGGKTRGARLPVHGKRAAKRTRGLEASIVDHDVLPLRGLAKGDQRCVRARVAGSAALLVAKMHKIGDRVREGKHHRINDKDASDVLRLVRATPVAQMAASLDRLRRDDMAGETTVEAMGTLATLFRAPGSQGVVMAVRALRLDLPADLVETQLVGYVRELTARLSL